MMKFLVVVLLAFFVVYASALSNAALEAKAHKIIQAMQGHLTMPSGQYGCWCPVIAEVDSSRGHWGMFYPDGLPRDCGQKYLDNTVCISRGLAQPSKFRGYTMVHESCHLYLYRLGQASKTSFSNYASEDLTDCVAKVLGAPLLNNLPGYGCKSSSHLKLAKALVKKYPPTTSWKAWK